MRDAVPRFGPEPPGDAVEIRRGPLARPDVRVRLPAEALIRLLLEGWPGEEGLAGMGIEGEVDRLRALVDAFEYPAGADERPRTGR